MSDQVTYSKKQKTLLVFLGIVLALLLLFKAESIYSADAFLFAQENKTAEILESNTKYSVEFSSFTFTSLFK